MELIEESKNQNGKEQNEKQIVEMDNEIRQILTSIENTQLKTIEILNRIEKKFLNTEGGKSEPVKSRPPFYYNKKPKK